MEQKSSCKKCQDSRDCYIRMLIRNDGVPSFRPSEQDIEIYNLAREHKCPVFDPADEEE